MLFLPLKRNGLLFILMVLSAALILKGQFYGDDSYFNPYLKLFAWVGGVVSLFIVGLGLIYTLICWIYLLVQLNKIDATIKIGLDGQKGEVGEVPFTLSLSKLLMPMIGFIKVRIVFKDASIFGPIIINSFSLGWKDLLPKEGTTNLWLNERKQYDIQGLIISCEDYLQFFSFSAFKKSVKSFYLYPPKKKVETDEILPSRSQEMKERIKTSKRVEGDYLNYKDFESGDDVRRIVWKIFAKNKELVVRVPEIFNPYASHINVFGSFYNDLSNDFESGYSRGMLNYYKDMLYNFCLSLERDDRKVNFKTDLPAKEDISVEKGDDMSYKLSCANWQKELAATELQVPHSEAILCVSSLMPASELEELVNRRPVNLLIVRASRYLDEQHLFNLKNLVLRTDEKSELGKLTWMLSGFRRKIRRNEKRIDELIASQNFKGQMI